MKYYCSHSGWTAISTSHRSYQDPQRESNRDSAGWGTRGSVAEWLARQATVLNCRGSTPTEGVDKTDAKSKLQSTLDENNFRESKAM
ncbi:unnamed protein product [Protopolystoma xenopodis]|uniref:Uncharacterized protein n=1 Tax=Protopolystoma xenopodis TaxID=117903 RepID=A0A448WQL6_9PLAT|nr:unnamed protein product [Protopolystoma xenopodis]